MTHQDTPSSAVDRALPTVLECINAAQRDGILRLPSVKSMATRAGVSGKSVWKAVRALCDQGALTVIPGGGIFASGGTHALDPSKLAMPGRPRRSRVALQARDEQVRLAISQDILGGRLPPGSALPKYKELQLRYGACYVTLRRALAMLAQERRIEAHGKGFRVCQTGPLRGRPLLVHVGRMGPSPGLVRATPFSPEFWMQVDQERMRLSIDLDLMEYESALGISADPNAGPPLRERYARRTILGYLVSTIGMTNADIEQLLLEPIVAGKPVAILGEGRPTALGRAFLRSGLVRTFILAGGELAGELVAEHLLQLGHRRIAFITPFGDAEFSIRRSNGTRRAMERAGSGCAMEMVDVTSPDWDSLILSDPDYRAFRRAVDRFETRTMVAYDEREGLFPDNIVSHHMMSQYMKRHLKPHFDRLVADPSITAWVCVNDMVGLIALRYLRGTSAPVPGRVSVVSFDDTIESFGMALTSYNFHVPAVVHSMIEHVAGGGRRRDEDPQVEIPGTVMARQSSGPAQR